jgi:tetratricopeptide (TPR) repeat protein
LGELLLHTNRIEEAEVVLQQALQVFRKDPPLIGKMGATMNNLAAIRRQQGRDREAIELLQECVNLVELDAGRDHPRLIRPLNNLATTYLLLGQAAGAEPVFQRALAIAEAKLGLEHPMYARVLLNYSDCVKMSGDKKRAKTLAARARQLIDKYDVASGKALTVDASSFR